MFTVAFHLQGRRSFSELYLLLGSCLVCPFLLELDLITFLVFVTGTFIPLIPQIAKDLNTTRAAVRLGQQRILS